MGEYKWVLEIVTLAQGKCIRLPAQIAVTKQKFLLSQKKAGLFTAETATRSTGSFRFYIPMFSVQNLFFIYFYYHDSRVL